MDREEARHYRVLGDVVPHLRRAVAADGGGAQEVRRPRRVSRDRRRREREPEHGSASSRKAADAVHVPLGRERRSGARLSSPEHVLRRCSRHQRARRVYGGRGGSGYRGGVTAVMFANLLSAPSYRPAPPSRSPPPTPYMRSDRSPGTASPGKRSCRRVLPRRECGCRACTGR